ncbi:MAG: Mo-dependent nitrogenase C-terminal domain-containing protein [Geminocystis sp.]|nr:Mo-dependent nitrogenase C-terminal domain-containing protein [Geminocystis sp.]HIK38424.1 Mo-dependent nitrogenase [Geminocystis sp. M7585_C2015_104]MCS7147769.1 Mo-dependent nitrogenase C-terminal domain-containing protein [Geminocystis sp.]MCX8079211.1 Mo-dependent nitrogenase C-terminal domain-containing protein [Geminocystis sp.]MDW8116657.1 Mo-dependent nitrogenase C-terminal domain-containing protein [Geminocystis sp.]
MGITDYLFSEIVLQNCPGSDDLNIVNRGFLRDIGRRIRCFDPLSPLKKWIDSIEIKDEKTARIIDELIPSQCPFAREIRCFNRTILKIPPLCKLNPLYDNLMALKFRAVCYLESQKEGK